MRVPIVLTSISYRAVELFLDFCQKDCRFGALVLQGLRQEDHRLQEGNDGKETECYHGRGALRKRHF